MAAVFVGIDISRDFLDVHIRPSSEAFRLSRDDAGLDSLIERLLPLAPSIVALEATGGFESLVAASLSAAGLPVVVLNPAQVRSFAHSLGQRAKSDRIDAAVIAAFAEAINPPLRTLPDEHTRLLSALITRRRQIVQMIVAERQRSRLLSSPRLTQSVERLLKSLQAELKVLDKEIDDTIHGSPLWRATDALLQSVPGVGPGISHTLIAVMPELGSLDAKEAASLAGLAPFTRQSGQWKGKSIISGGRSDVRSMLYMGAVSCTRFNPTLKAFYDRLVSAGKAKQLALIAVARKLITILNAIVRDQKPWRTA